MTEKDIYTITKLEKPIVFKNYSTKYYALKINDMNFSNYNSIPEAFQVMQYLARHNKSKYNVNYDINQPKQLIKNWRKSDEIN